MIRIENREYVKSEKICRHGEGFALRCRRRVEVTARFRCDISGLSKSVAMCRRHFFEKSAKVTA